MDTHPFHNYLFFKVKNGFYQLPKDKQDKQKAAFGKWLNVNKKLIITPYATLGFKPQTTFMLWCRGQNPRQMQSTLPDLFRTDFGQWLKLTYTFFGIVRESQYSGRSGKPEQTIQNFTERLPYFIVYPFTKTTEWHQMDLEERKKIMGEHIKVGVGYPEIRQCLLYSYGIDDYEFVVSYETDNLEHFQDLVINMRSTKSRVYTQTDIPIFTCIHKPLKDLLEWL